MDRALSECATFLSARAAEQQARARFESTVAAMTKEERFGLCQHILRKKYPDLVVYQAPAYLCLQSKNTTLASAVSTTVKLCRMPVEPRGTGGTVYLIYSA